MSDPRITDIKKGMLIKTFVAKYTVSYNTAYGFALRHGLKFKKQVWARGYEHCTNPDCTRTRNGKTASRHKSKGLCNACVCAKNYQGDEAFRERVRKNKREAYAKNPEVHHAYNRRWRAKNAESARRSSRNCTRVRRAGGFDSAIIVGTLVNAPWSNDYEGAPRPLRVKRRYMEGPDAVCDLEYKDKVFTQVPMSSLTLVIERAGKNT